MRLEFWMMFAAALLAAPAAAQAPHSSYADRLKEGDAVLRDFHFVDGERLPELRIHYATLGMPRRDAKGEIVNAVMVLHGTGGSGRQFLAPQFADELYGPGQPLDIARYYIILPDDIGHGKSSKPSDGMRMHFPKYDYDDMVEAERRMLVEGLGVTHLRLLMGTSMGCMHSFVWAEAHPDFARAILPLACLPTTLAGHNRMWREAAILGIESDPAWAGGDYKAEPLQGLRTAETVLQIAGFAPLYLQKAYPTRAAADAYIRERIERGVRTLDANDLVYQLDASRNYDPWPGLERIEAPLVWVNSEDDFINPPGYGIAEDAARRMKTGRYVLIHATTDTRGHGTHTWAKFWRQELIDLLQRTAG
ncbi:MAG TPA: alpha/beta fold hydrolase [Allosphingosinicella sp.]|jgi:homoserine O-acetyltransferase